VEAAATPSALRKKEKYNLLNHSSSLPQSAAIPYLWAVWLSSAGTSVIDKKPYTLPYRLEKEREI
jgi:hypothetical protein